MFHRKNQKTSNVDTAAQPGGITHILVVCTSLYHSLTVNLVMLYYRFTAIMSPIFPYLSIFSKYVSHSQCFPNVFPHLFHSFRFSHHFPTIFPPFSHRFPTSFPTPDCPAMRAPPASAERSPGGSSSSWRCNWRIKHLNLNMQVF